MIIIIILIIIHKLIIDLHTNTTNTHSTNNKHNAVRAPSRPAEAAAGSYCLTGSSATPGKSPCHSTALYTWLISNWVHF